VICSVIPVFRQQAEQLLNSSTMSAVDFLAKALAKAVVSFLLYFKYFSFSAAIIINGKAVFQGYTDIKKRSLLTSLEDYTTLHLQTGRPMWSPG
jgi:ATP-dependent RNA helicase DDX21